MTDTSIYHRHPPGLWSLYSKALLPKTKPSGDELRIPGLSTRLIGVSTANDNLKRYRKVCGFDTQANVPITWPHILAFPLHLKLLTEKDFPLPLLGSFTFATTSRSTEPSARGNAGHHRTAGRSEQYVEGLGVRSGHRKPGPQGGWCGKRRAPTCSGSRIKAKRPRAINLPNYPTTLRPPTSVPRNPLAGNTRGYPVTETRYTFTR